MSVLRMPTQGCLLGAGEVPGVPPRVSGAGGEAEPAPGRERGAEGCGQGSCFAQRPVSSAQRRSSEPPPGPPRCPPGQGTGREEQSQALLPAAVETLLRALAWQPWGAERSQGSAVPAPPLPWGGADALLAPGRLCTAQAGGNAGSGLSEAGSQASSAAPLCPGTGLQKFGWQNRSWGMVSAPGATARVRLGTRRTGSPAARDTEGRSSAGKCSQWK